MKKVLLIALAILILAVAFQATKTVSAAQDNSGALLSAAAKGGVLELQDIVIRKNATGKDINFRVRVKNTGTVAATKMKDNLVIYLRVKNAKTGAWDELQKWSNIDVIKPGETVSRDRTPGDSKNIDVLSNEFTLQAEIVLKTPGTTKIAKAKLEGTYPVDSVKNP
ncbi:MAG: hypothetical protein RDV48_30060 [Candidatus Eremiobacteraeota bacterium]|nr:hypothetical protein [Candidatus Eremiobacteraeota bacterium]